MLARPMPNVMAALSNIGGASVQRRKVWLTPTTRVPYIAAKTRNSLKFAGVPQTNETISAAAEVHHITGTCGGDIAA